LSLHQFFEAEIRQTPLPLETSGRNGLTLSILNRTCRAPMSVSNKEHDYMKSILTTTLFAALQVQAYASERIVLESANQDIQILQAWETRNLYQFEDMQALNCPREKVGGNPYTISWRADCAGNALDVLGAPSMHPVLIFYYQSATNAESVQSDWRCNAGEVRAVIKDSVIHSPRFLRVGFYHSEHSSIRTIARTELREVGRVTLKSGEPAGVFRFVSLARCWNGTASSSAYQNEVFKPFVDFGVENAEGNLDIYRQWENVAENFVLGQKFGYSPSDYVRSFNREAELLK
jgi:hypothetical protein